MRVTRRSSLGLLGLLALGCQEVGIKVLATPPEVVIAGPIDGSSHYRGEPVSLLAMITLYDSSDFVDATYQWWDGTNPICGGEGNFSADGFAICDWGFETPGERTLTIDARDASDEMATASITVSIMAEEQRQVTFCASGGRLSNTNVTGVFCMAPTELAGTPAATENFIWQPGPIYWVSP